MPTSPSGWPQQQLKFLLRWVSWQPILTVTLTKKRKIKKAPQTNSYSLDFRLKTSLKRAGISPFIGCWCVYNEQSTTRNMLRALLVEAQPNRVSKIHHYCRKVMAFLDALWEITVIIGRSQERLVKLNSENIYWENSKNSKTVINQTGVSGLKLTSLKQSFFTDDVNWWIYI